MASNRIRLKDVARRAARDPWRSPLYHWLRKHHTRLLPSLSVSRVDWQPVLDAAARAGATDDKGCTPSRRTVWRTWRNVCQSIAAEEAAQAAKPPRKMQPRDLPADWRPAPVAATPPVPSGSALVPAPSQALVPLPSPPHPAQVRVVGQSIFGPIKSGPLTPEPDYTGMDDVDRKIARMKWAIALGEPG